MKRRRAIGISYYVRRGVYDSGEACIVREEIGKSRNTHYGLFNGTRRL